MDLEQRFEFLARCVLPNDDHATARLQVGFVPVGGVLLPAESAAHSDNSRPVSAGGEIVSPARELVLVAKELGRLQEVREQFQDIHADGIDQQIARLTGLVLVNCAADELTAANEQLGELYRIVAEHHTIPPAWKAPLLLAIQAGSNRETTAAAARDLAYDVVQTEIDNIHPRDWRSFHRHVMVLAEQCTVRISADPTGLRGRTNPLHTENDDAEHEPPIGLRDIRDTERGLTQWRNGTLLTAFSRAGGNPNDVWHWDGRGVYKASGHRKGYLYFQSPLRGNYEIEFDATALKWRNTHVTIGGHWVGGIESLDRFMLGTLTNPGYRFETLPSPLTKIRYEMHYRAVVRGTQVTFYANGRELRTVELPQDHDPWVAFGRVVKNSLKIWNVRITGEPIIPNEIRLTVSPDLTGWVPYFNESIGGTSGQARLWRQDGDPATGGIISGSRRSDCEPGSHFESLVYYHRPMLEDGTIEYRFHYAEGMRHTHPALGRTVFLLDPNGVRIHQLTDGMFEREDLPPDNGSTETQNRRGSGELPLRNNDWNDVRLKLTGDTVDLFLNNKHIFQRVLAPTNVRTFGLFHYADREQAYAGNIVWRGEWPKEVPPIEHQELSGHETDFLAEAWPKLSDVFEYRFADKLSAVSDFRVVDGDRDRDFEAGAEGLTVHRSGTVGYANTVIATEFGATGDFDITLKFDKLETNPGPAGNCNIMLQVVLDDATSSECNVRRRHNRYAGRTDHKHLAYADVVLRNAEGDRRGSIGDFPMESAAGTLRIARRGGKIYTLFAEGDSSQFRITGWSEFPMADVRIGGFCLRAVTYKQSSMSVRLRQLVVRAEKLNRSAPVEKPSPETLTKLNSNREKLPLQANFDFASNPVTSEDFFRWGDRRPWQPNAGGLQVIHSGTERWTSSGLSLGQSIEGDFDITATLELQDIINPDAGKDSVIYLKASFGDDEQSQADVTYQETSSGRREVHARTGHTSVGARVRFRQVGAIAADNVISLRLARHGTTAYFISRSAPDEPEVLMATAKITAAPIPKRALAFMVHSGGEGRETHVLLKRVEVRASGATAVRAAARPEPKPPKKGLFESLFDAFN